MTIEFLTDLIWDRLKASAGSSRQPSWVAVAYFSANADRFLPLADGSRLVVDASRAAVQSGQTHPDTLRRLVERGVRVYSVENLHAKVFVIGRRAYVGSPNVSSSSAGRLVEAILATSDSTAVAEARAFVRRLCQEALSPEYLMELQKSYRPPRFPHGSVGQDHAVRRPRPATSALRIVTLEHIVWPENEAGLVEAGRKAARARREHRGNWEIQEFRLTGRNAVKRHEMVIQLVDESPKRTLVEPPGKVLHVACHKTGRGAVTYVLSRSAKYAAGRL